MTMGAVEKIANAVMYEGYVLYPYRPSAIKNQKRFNFGVLYPREYCDLQFGTDAWEMRTECLLLGDAAAAIEVKVRFLTMTTQQGWQEGVERDVFTPACSLELLAAQSHRHPFSFADGEEILEGALELNAVQLEENLYRISLSIRNLAALGGTSSVDRDQALLQSFVSVHSILHAAGGEFVSLLDPPERLKTAAAGCRNIGAWPVLAGEEGQKDLLLASPIILYDYPQIAPESAGDLCDSTEIDEILALRILTLTDAEKLEVRNGDNRARRILERTETLPPEHFQKLHGALRGLRSSTEEAR